MIDLCYDCVGVSKEKKDAKEVKGNRELLDVLPGKIFEDVQSFLSISHMVLTH
ncbi:hypothetical protein Bca4012_071179 [Brassica carinata]